MAAKEISVKKYGVRLRGEERERLNVTQVTRHAWKTISPITTKA
jgi:hypothetical protein